MSRIAWILSKIPGRAREVGLLPSEEEPPRKDPLLRTWHDPDRLWGWLTTVQNGPVVNRYMFAAFALFVIGGLEALMMRTQLAVPNNDWVGPSHYNQLFTMHGSIMMFLVTVPLMEGLASFALPVLLGARELPFPRMTAFGFWTFLFGAILLYTSRAFAQVPEVGWTAYVPLANLEHSPDLGVDFWLLGLSVAEVAALGAGIELAIAVLKMRAPGMTLSRTPVYAWSILVTAYAMLCGFTPLLVATTLLELERKLGTRFFDVAAGGDPLLWQHLFWIFGHPDVYIQFIPATGIISLVIAAFARRPLVSENLIVASLIATAIVSFGLWVHHLFSAGLSVLGMSFFAAASMAIAVPSGIQVVAWIATLWLGRPVFTTALLFALGFIVTFVAGGVTGVMVAAIPFDWQVHDTHFVVAHFHYVLVGGVVFPIFAGFYYWMPKMVGRLLDERLGRWNFWLMFLGFQLTFFPMHITGLLGMPRRSYTYQPGLGWEIPNLISTVGAFVMGLGILIFMWNVIQSVLLGRGERPDDNPWDAGTLDWATPTPPPDEGYRVIPLVQSRYPLWEQKSIERGDPDHERVVRGLAQTPHAWRAQLITSVIAAEPQAIAHLAGPSLWPLLAGIALTLNFVATLFDLYWLLAFSTVATVGATIGWLWPSKLERERRLAGDGDSLHGLPVYTSGTSALGWWTMIHIVLVMAVATACLIFSYYYLHSKAPAWPPAGYDRPELLLPSLATGALALGGGMTYLALRAIRAGSQGGLRGWLTGALLAGGAFLWLTYLGWQQEGLSLSGHAYASLFLTLGWYQVILVVGGLIVLGVVLVQALLGYFDHRRFLAIQNAAIYSAASVVNWVVLYGVVYLTPYLSRSQV
ncbi:MAG: cbb3-type cytochrome c oxidase subunit I [Chloroflexi bacterium]|nr:cbb3-type cytochrome c oxidase subunit I [Chloroflexota bacterium]